MPDATLLTHPEFLPQALLLLGRFERPAVELQPSAGIAIAKKKEGKRGLQQFVAKLTLGNSDVSVAFSFKGKALHMDCTDCGTGGCPHALLSLCCILESTVEQLAARDSNKSTPESSVLELRIRNCFSPPGTISSAWTRER